MKKTGEKTSSSGGKRTKRKGTKNSKNSKTISSNNNESKSDGRLSFPVIAEEEKDLMVVGNKKSRFVSDSPFDMCSDGQPEIASNIEEVRAKVASESPSRTEHVS